MIQINQMIIQIMDQMIIIIFQTIKHLDLIIFRCLVKLWILSEIKIKKI